MNGSDGPDFTSLLERAVRALEGVPSWVNLGVTLVSVGIAAVSLYLAFIGIRNTRRELEHLKDTVSVNRQMLVNTAYSSINSTIVSINYSFLDRNVQFPVRMDESIRPEDQERIRNKTILMLHQINLLYQVFLYREIIDPKVVEAHNRWAKHTVYPWIAVDKPLVQTLKHITSGRDLLHDDFVIWLREVFP